MLRFCMIVLTMALFPFAMIATAFKYAMDFIDAKVRGE